jgi:hypothetical protein
MRNKLKYVYFIVYTFVNNKGCLPTTGTVSLGRNKKLDTMAEVKSATEYLKNEFGYEDLMITNFILLNKRGIL